MPRYKAKCLINGTASGRLLYSDVALSVWGGIDLRSGEVIDRHHPLSGQYLNPHVLAIPSGRGSCSGSIGILELLLNGKGPIALIFETTEQIITLGVIVAKLLFDREIPVVVLSPADFASISGSTCATVIGNEVVVDEKVDASLILDRTFVASPVDQAIELSTYDKSLLECEQPSAKHMAMKILLEFAKIQGATSFLTVSQVHIDACVYTGPASLRFAEFFLGYEDAKFAVPTSMNSISIDQRRWAEIGMEPVQAKEANKLGAAYVRMGARPTFTCAPYLLDTKPSHGEQIAWGESNAVVFANSVLGARTQKYPDFIDVCIALTGRAPSSGCHVKHNRQPQVVITVPVLKSTPDESIYPLLGYCIGHEAGADIPMIIGMQDMSPTTSDLKAFGAAFATTSSAPMFHIRNITPESTQEQYQNLQFTRRVTLTPETLLHGWKTLNTAQDPSVHLIAVGNPHFSLDEHKHLAELCFEYTQADPTSTLTIPLVITTSRTILSQFTSTEKTCFETLQSLGVEFITDTCWCMLTEPVVPAGGGNIMTNSAKYAHYAPGLVKRKVHFGSLRECVQAAFQGRREREVPTWLDF